MAHYNLQPNEVVLLKEEHVEHGGRGSHSDELILTNLNIVVVKFGMFGKVKGVLTFPINQIKVYNQQAQAILTKSGSVDYLEVYFLNGQEKFHFSSGSGFSNESKKKALIWIAKINEVVTGQKAPEVAGRSAMALPGADIVAGALKGTFDVFKSKFASTPAKISSKCSACGAQISGTGGRVVSCGYCGTEQQL